MSEEVRALLAAYPVVIQVPVFWGDMDSMRHVNNVVYFRWFEEARIRILDSVLAKVRFPDRKIGMILAHVECDFRRQTLFPDTMHVGSRIAKVGRSSLQIRHAVVSESQKAVVAEGEATNVLYHYGEQRSEPIPAELRTALEALVGSM